MKDLLINRYCTTGTKNSTTQNNFSSLEVFFIWWYPLTVQRFLKSSFPVKG